MANYYDKNYFKKMSSDIKEMFAKLQDALKCRETQLLRQIEVLSQHCQLTDTYDKYTKEISLVFEHSNDLFQSISSLGKIHLNGLHCTSEVFQIEDYQKQEIDHDSFNKYLEKTTKPHCDILKVKHCTKDTCTDPDTNTATDTDTKLNSNTTLLECIDKDDPKLCQHKTNNQINDDDGGTMQRKCNLIDDKVRQISLAQPVPIQHWMNDIILETELEPTSNNIMEHSQIE